MTTARDFFDRVRAASQDAERCRTQLLALESRALSLGGGGFEPRVRSTPDPQRQQSRSNAYIDRENALRQRQKDDYAIIDAACVVLYGTDERRGLDAVVSPVWADILWWRYLDCATWDTVSSAVSYSVRQCQILHDSALDWIDGNAFASDILQQTD
jgi:hypothetical protein